MSKMKFDLSNMHEKVIVTSLRYEWWLMRLQRSLQQCKMWSKQRMLQVMRKLGFNILKVENFQTCHSLAIEHIRGTGT